MNIQPPQQQNSAWRDFSFSEEKQFVRNVAAKVCIARLALRGVSKIQVNMKRIRSFVRNMIKVKVLKKLMDHHAQCVQTIVRVQNCCLCGFLVI